jgi:hypothetical protein
MKSKILISFLLVVSSWANAQVSFREATAHLMERSSRGGGRVLETWMKYTCHGPLSVKGVYPIVHGDVVSFYIPVNRDKSYKTIREVQAEDSKRFERMNRICTLRKFDQTNQTGLSDSWLGWYSVHWDAKMKFSEVVITDRACRKEGSPCSLTSQCCGASPTWTPYLSSGSKPYWSSGGTKPSPSTTGTNLICSKETNACETAKPNPSRINVSR